MSAASVRGASGGHTIVSDTIRLRLDMFCNEDYGGMQMGLPWLGGNRIVGGSEASAFFYPFAARLYSSVNTFNFGFCTASLISPTAALSAAHCCTGLSDIYVGVGKHTSVSVNFGECAETIPSSSISIHPNYDENVLNDICVIELTRVPRCMGGLFVNSLELDGLPVWRDDTVSENATVIGWGSTTVMDGAQARRLREAAQFLYGRSTCLQFLSSAHLANPQQLCAGRIESDTAINICSGDSGGPLFVRRDDRFVQVGISSWG